LIGVISDTHGYLDPRVPELFAGVSHILHAGDVGPATLIGELERIAPVTAVLGNTDSFLALRDFELVELSGRKILVQHIVNPQQPDDALARRIERAQPDLVVYGHTHVPFWGMSGGTRFLNPGYAGRQRFQLHRSVALLRCADGTISVEFKRLGD
jgi:putative phosphoesterase